VRFRPVRMSATHARFSLQRVGAVCLLITALAMGSLVFHSDYGRAAIVSLGSMNPVRP
jgi:hypothetical protein